MQIREGSLVLSFDEGSRVLKYDESQYFREKFSKTAGGSKGVDAVCLAKGACWLVEIKEIQHRLSDDSGLHGLKIQRALNDAALQVRDTMAGLAAARTCADSDERQFSQEALATGNWRVVVHMEQSDARTSRLRPQAVSLASVQSKIRKANLVGAIDPRAIVVDSTSGQSVPWRTTSLPCQSEDGEQ